MNIKFKCSNCKGDVKIHITKETENIHSVTTFICDNCELIHEKITDEIEYIVHFTDKKHKGTITGPFKNNL